MNERRRVKKKNSKKEEKKKDEKEVKDPKNQQDRGEQCQPRASGCLCRQKWKIAHEAMKDAPI